MLGLKKLLIVTVDTDVVVIALYALQDLDLKELWIEFGRGKLAASACLTLKPQERRYAGLYFSGMPSEAVILCPSSLEKQRKQQ